MQPEGGAGHPPSRRLGGTLRAWLRNGEPIRWLGLGGALIPLLMLVFVLVTLIRDILDRGLSVAIGVV